jgi:hypothetical protein
MDGTLTGVGTVLFGVGICGIVGGTMGLDGRAADDSASGINRQSEIRNKLFVSESALTASW